LGFISPQIRKSVSKEFHHLEELWVNCSIILKWVLKKWDVEVWSGISMAYDRDR
jgi:hypothetical protein